MIIVVLKNTLSFLYAFSSMENLQSMHSTYPHQSEHCAWSPKTCRRMASRLAFRLSTFELPLTALAKHWLDDELP